MSYYLRGSDGQGLGAVSPPVYEQCGIDPVCIARNDVKEQAYLKQLYAELGISDISSGTPVYYVKPNSSVAPTSPSGGHLTFTSSRGSNMLQVGDTWLVSITGATPNSQVTVKAGSDTTPMGSTDALGNFSLAGTAHAGDIGSWNETWAVGGVPSGSFSFTVSAAPNAAVLQTAQIPVTKVPTVPVGGTLQTPGSTAGASSSSTVIGGFDLSSIPTWGWLAAAGVAAFFMFGKGGR